MQKHDRSISNPRGFTVIEFVFLCFIIGLMLAILAPGLLAGIEKARRIQCSNNMYQLALGLNNYHDTHKNLPPAWICDRRDQNAPQWGWNTLMLGLIEQSALYRTLQPGPISITEVFELGPTAQQALECDISAFQCDAGRYDEPHPTKRFDTGIGVPQGWQAPNANYVANTGFFCRSSDYENHGVMYGNSAIPMRAVVDGTSSTFLIGERDGLGGAGTWIGIANPQDPGVNGFGWAGGVVSVPMNCPTIEGCRDQGFSSQHPGGSLFAFCDGSVHFISETIDFNNGSADRFDSTSDTLLTEEEKAELGVYQRLGIRDDERVISKLP